MWLTLSDSNYPCLQQSFMDPKTFEPLNVVKQKKKKKKKNAFPIITLRIL